MTNHEPVLQLSIAVILVVSLYENILPITGILTAPPRIAPYNLKRRELRAVLTSLLKLNRFH